MEFGTLKTTRTMHYSNFFVLQAFFSAASACLHHATPDTSAEIIAANIHRRSNGTPPPTNKTGIRNVHIFNGTHFHPGVVAIDGSKITFNVHNVDTWINGQGGFLIPGLIDAHCHPSTVGDLQQMSSYGVTTALNMNCANYAFCASLRNQTGMTSFLSANQGIVGFGSGHQKIFNIPSSQCLNTTAEIPQFINWGIGNHSDWIKIVAESGGPTQEEQNEIVTYSHSKDQFTTTHAADFPSYNQAILSGTDGIQHVPGDASLTPSMLSTMKTNNKWVTPTTSLIQAFIASPQALAISSYTNQSFGIGIANVKMMRDAGMPLLAGTDAVSAIAGAALHLNHPLGPSLHYELENLVNAVGFHPAEALRAATSLIAQYHRLPDRGSIAEGLRADLVLLGENPLVNISATRNIVRVWNEGVQFMDINSTYTGA
ncbi:hypothetical protein LTR10_017528 [Elasticomyces elasticus]|uniref:Amidohydrolase-related domain-containing protein n=1 Tax=Exophiala sideris TaxID=1016849 RepID=A0ABR0IZW6_9EURO|nr:hypothetical protein LTR10_017528 [Elasticomyces elasticus]KAK5028159.1 hypothetical protein LTR13_009147 [Exophiala sideris]KAK5052816.1 hypothetical protein LTR69_009642 [Exophiala sideris]KAK5178428.1 hypothetical protein LTR44_009053 [Eurotiomycetes sp. CCFEE 6388]